jgi:hypothetical protein
VDDPNYLETYYNLGSDHCEIVYIESDTMAEAEGSIESAVDSLKSGELLLLAVVVQPDENWSFADDVKDFQTLFTSHYEKTGDICKSMIDGLPYNHLDKKSVGVLFAKLQRV